MSDHRMYHNPWAGVALERHLEIHRRRLDTYSRALRRNIKIGFPGPDSQRVLAGLFAEEAARARLIECEVHRRLRLLEKLRSEPPTEGGRPPLHAV